MVYPGLTLCFPISPPCGSLSRSSRQSRRSRHTWQHFFIAAANGRLRNSLKHFTEKVAFQIRNFLCGGVGDFKAEIKHIRACYDHAERKYCSMRHFRAGSDQVKSIKLHTTDRFRPPPKSASAQPDASGHTFSTMYQEEKAVRLGSVLGRSSVFREKSCGSTVCRT